MADRPKRLRTYSKSKGKGASTPASGNQEQQHEEPRAQEQRLWVDDTYEEVEFATESQFTKFQQLKKRQVVPTRYLDSRILQDMGIKDALFELMGQCGLGNWCTMWNATSKRMTYEFMSSVGYGKIDGVLHLTFRLNNETHSVSYVQYCEIMGFEVEEIPEVTERDSRVVSLWPRISGRQFIPGRNMFASDVQHPVLRVFFKFARETLFPSDSPHVLRNPEVHTLARALLPYPRGQFSLPLALWKFYRTTSNVSGETAICLGGHVMRLGEGLGIFEPVAFIDKYAIHSLLHKGCLVKAGFIVNNPDLRWVCTKTTQLSMANAIWPPLTPDAPSYLLEGNPPQPAINPSTQPPRPDSRANRDLPVYRRGTRVFSGEGSSSGATFAESDAESLTSIHEKLDQIIRTQAIQGSQLAELRQEFEQTMYPIYNYHYQAGMVPPGHSHPHWFEQQAAKEDFFDVSLARGFDHLTIQDGRFYNWAPPASHVPMDTGVSGGGADVEAYDDRDPAEGGLLD